MNENKEKFTLQMGEKGNKYVQYIQKKRRKIL